MKHKGYVEPLIALIIVLSYVLFGNVSVIVAQQAERIQGNKVATVSVLSVSGTAQILSKVELEKQRDKTRVLGATVPTAWKPVRANTTLNVGDQLRTGIDSTMELKLDDGTLVMLESDTLLILEELTSVRAEGRKTTQFKLEKGTVRTTQPAKILGQTNQIIRTDNGLVNTSLGEVEVEKPEQTVKLAALLPQQWPLLVQNAGDPDQTNVLLLKGTAKIQSSGKGQMNTRSLIPPSTCLSQEGVQFTLTSLGSEVEIVRSPEDNGFRLLSEEIFLLLAATEGISNTLKMTTQSGGLVDIEGIEVADLDKQASILMRYNPLVTIGFSGADAAVTFECDPRESKALSDYDILGQGVTVLRSGTGISRPMASRGAVSPPIPTVSPALTPTPAPALPEGAPIPTATPTERPEGPTPTPTPTPPSIPPGVSPPEEPKIPVTHTFPRNPRIIDNIDVTPGGPCGTGTLGVTITVRFEYENFLPQIIPGTLRSSITDNTWQPMATSTYRTPQDLVGMTYSYSPNEQLEKGTMTYDFCYIPISYTGPEVFFSFRIFDREPNGSNVRRCSGDISGPFICTP